MHATTASITSQVESILQASNLSLQADIGTIGTAFKSSQDAVNLQLRGISLALELVKETQQKHQSQLVSLLQNGCSKQEQVLSEQAKQDYKRREKLDKTDSEEPGRPSAEASTLLKQVHNQLKLTRHFSISDIHTKTHSLSSIAIQEFFQFLWYIVQGLREALVSIW